MRALALALPFALLTLPAAAQECPPAGASFMKYTVLQEMKITSTGQTNPLTGCEWLLETGEKIWLRPGSIMRPVEESEARKAADAADAAEAFSGRVVMGVYECDAPGFYPTGFYFGLIDGANYRDYDGDTGKYKLEGKILTMTSGPLKGISYERQSRGVYKPLDEAGRIGSIRCMLNEAKSLNGRW